MNSTRQRQACTDAHPFLIQSLSAAKDVEIKDGCCIALSPLPWLRMDFNGPPPAGRWIRLTYLASLFDQLVRPLIRYIVGTQYYDEILPGPLFGRAIWLGYVPKGTHEIWISPTNQIGPFGFSVESVTTVPTARLMWRCLREDPYHCALGLGAQLIGLQSAAMREFRRVLSPTRLENYGEWRKLRFRNLDLENLDSPRTNWQVGPHIRLITSFEVDRLADLSALAVQLSAQPYPNWTLAVISPPELESLLRPLSAWGERIIIIRPAASARELVEGLSDRDLVAPIRSGDDSPAYAIAALAEAASSDSSAEVFYGDEEVINADERTQAVRLRADWSPAFYETFPYIAGAEFIRVKALKRFDGDIAAVEFLQAPGLLSKIAARHPLSTRHIRRVMRTRRSEPVVHSVFQKAPDSRGPRFRREIQSGVCATIIIPTKDRIDLLERCVSSLTKKTKLQDIEVLIVDNGSRLAKSRRFLSELERDSRFRVISRPDPFNFSQLCNDGAAEAKAPALVFLNNDTEIIDGNWLEPLLFWSQHRGVGAVGAKLLYPSGRLQHAGVVLGLDGLVGHLERMLERKDPGYFGHLCVPHEVSAVTAACLAVEKRKFDAVGGFDALNLPVDLNDVDLCLRLAEQGWKSIFTPESVLIHHESASRGKKMRAEEVYQKERDYFRLKWLHRLRDDPYFHPALSLDCHDVALG